MKSTRLILNRRTIVSGLLAVFVSTDLYAVPPVISSVSMRDGTVTVSGLNFGQKAVAAPHKFQPFTSTTPGMTYSQAGFDFVGGTNAGTANNHVDMSDGVGGGSWLHITPGPPHGSFSHFGHLLPAGTDSLYVSYWLKLTKITPLPPPPIDCEENCEYWGQVKGVRAGSMAPGWTDPVSEMYRINPKFTWSLFTPLDDGSTSGPTAFGNQGSGTLAETLPGGHTRYPDGNPLLPMINSEWHFTETYYRMNTPGISNGVTQVLFDGVQYHDQSDWEVRELSSNHFDYVQYCPGLSDRFDLSVWQARFSRIYTDTTRARVFLGNAPTLAGCQGRFLLPPTAWSDTSISADSAVNVPTGYDWVYVSNSDGEINEIGYISPPARPRRLRVR